MDVQVRRKGGADVQDAVLRKDSPKGSVQLTRTVADFLSDRQSGRADFEYRTRLLRVLSADAWHDWQGASGTNLSVYFS